MLTQKLAGPQSEKPAISAWSALWKLVMEPGATYAGLRDRMPVLPGYVFAMVTMLVVVSVGLPQTLNLALDTFSSQNLPASALSVAKVTTVVFAFVGALAAPWVTGLVQSLVALFWGQFQGGGVSFKSYLGMIGYARIPVMLGALAQLPLTIRARSLQEAAAISLSPAVLLSVDANPLLRAFLTTLNPFTIWCYALLAIGFAAMHRTKPARSLSFVLTLYIVALLMALYGATVAAKVPGM